MNINAISTVDMTILLLLVILCVYYYAFIYNSKIENFSGIATSPLFIMVMSAFMYLILHCLYIIIFGEKSSLTSDNKPTTSHHPIQSEKEHAIELYEKFSGKRYDPSVDLKKYFLER